ncbi:MAG TPA: mechanosensitive ion channel family protein [Bryobacteraceae bacterium]
MNRFRHRADAKLIVTECGLNLGTPFMLSKALRLSLVTVLFFTCGATNVWSAAPPSDELKRTTPRSAIYGFLEACHQQQFVLASRYLDLRGIRSSERLAKGPELAKQLQNLLDTNPRFEVQRLSDRPEGNMEERLRPDRDILVTMGADGSTATLDLQRVTEGDLQVWLVSQQSVALIPSLSSLAGESVIEKKLPAFLVQTQFLGTPLWAWLAMVLLALILAALSRLLSRLVIRLLRPLARRYASAFHAHRLETLTEPLRLLVSVITFRALLEFISTSALLRDYILKALVLLFTLGVAALVMRIVDLISDQLLSRMNSRERALSYSILPLGVRFVKICIFVIAVLFVLSAWGYHTNTILAGLGVGGLAVALAAQKTIENLFGGISVITDRPVLVGDLCQFGGQIGTVEDIGLRSTRIRTNDRTVVTVPNSSFSTMTLENYSRRDRMWFHPTLQLRRETTGSQVREMMDALDKMLREHPKIDVGGMPIRFTKIGDQSLQIEIFAYVQTTDGDEFLKVQNELLLRFLDLSADRGIGFAVPLLESYNITGENPPGRTADSDSRPAASLPEERPTLS